MRKRLHIQSSSIALGLNLLLARVSFGIEYTLKYIDSAVVNELTVHNIPVSPSPRAPIQQTRVEVILRGHQHANANIHSMQPEVAIYFPESETTDSGTGTEQSVAMARVVLADGSGREEVDLPVLYPPMLRGQESPQDCFLIHNAPYLPTAGGAIAPVFTSLQVTGADTIGNIRITTSFALNAQGQRVTPEERVLAFLTVTPEGSFLSLSFSEEETNGPAPQQAIRQGGTLSTITLRSVSVYQQPADLLHSGAGTEMMNRNALPFFQEKQ